MCTSAIKNVLLTTTKEKENFYRLSRLLITGGTTVLRDVFDNIHHPSVLDSILANPGIKHILSKKNKLTNEPQRKTLYPSFGKYGKSKDFEISLLALLLQNICRLAPPGNGWFEMPDDCDISLSADITRIRMLRNQVYAHTNADMEITDSEFATLWAKITDVLIRIEGSFSESKKGEWIAATQELLTTPLTETDRQQAKELELWCIHDTETKEKLLTIEMGMKEITGELKKLQIRPQFCFKAHHKDHPLDHFCYDCKEKCCEMCAKIEPHGSHKVYPEHNDPELQNTREKINEEIRRAELKISQADEKIQSLSKTMRESGERLEKNVHDFVEECVNEIHFQEKQLMSDIARIRLQSDSVLDDIQTKVSKKQSEISQTLDYARKLVHEGDVLDICKEALPVIETLRKHSTIEQLFKPLSIENKIFARSSLFYDHLYSHNIGRIANLVDPLKCRVKGDGVDLSAKKYLGLETSFTLYTFSAEGKVVHVPSEEITVVVNYMVEDNNAFDREAYVKDNHDGKHIVSYIPIKTGTVLVTVNINHEHIQGSPFEVKVIPRQYESRRLLGMYGKGLGNFNGPWGAAENSKGDIYITDRDNNRVQVFNQEGSWQSSFGKSGCGDGDLIQPRGIAIDQDDDVIVVDNGNNRVQVFDKDGNFKSKFGGPGVEPGRLQNPYSVSFDDDQNLIISDGDNRRIQVFTPEGDLVRVFGQGDIQRSFFCIYHDGHYILSDFESQCVKFFNKDGVFQCKIGKRGTGDGEFDLYIRGLAIDKVGNLLVCDSFANRIQVFRPSGTSYEFADTFGSEGNKRGQLQRPTTVTVLRNGQLVITEFFNNRVQFFS